jgi:RNA polymerase sigma-70 factor (ECF subfamily)
MRILAAPIALVNARQPDDAAPGEALAALVARAQQGDRAAFEDIMVLSQQRVTATAWRLLGDREDARDAAQEVFLKAYRHLGTFKAEGDLRGWLYRITVNVCHDLRRRRRGPHLVSLEAEAERAALPASAGAGDAEAEVLRDQRRALIGRALARLPEKERTALVLRDLEGLDTEDVARILGSSAVTVRSQVSRAREKVREYCQRALGRDTCG